jgi:hypothetical protein
MRSSTPMLRLKALASSNPLVFILHESVMANLRDLPEAEAIERLKKVTRQILDHAIEQKVEYNEANGLNTPPKLDPHIIRDAVLRHRQRILGGHQHHA